MCLEPQGHCRHQGHVDGALVLCHAVGQGGGCQSCCSASCYLLLHPVPWGKGTEPCQAWRPLGCHLPKALSPIFHLWPLCSGHMPLSPAAPVYSGHQLLTLSLVPRQIILSQRGNPEGADVGQRAGAGSQQDHPSQCEMCPGPLSCLSAGSWGNPTSPISGRDPVPCERHRHNMSALSLPPCSSPTSQQLSSSCVPRDAQQGWPSPHIHNSVSLSHLDDQKKPLPPHGVHFQPRASSSLQLVTTVSEFLYINRAPNLNRYFFFFSVQHVSKVSEKPKEWPSLGTAQLCHPGGSFA